MLSASILVAVVLLLYVSYRYMLYPVFFSPLSKIPNAHFSSPISPLWISWIRKRSIENHTLLALHNRLGPIIRLGPSELSVSCVDGGVRTIYSGGYEKHAWYPNIFENYGVPNMFSTAESKPHSIRKRMISHVYSKSYLQSSQELNNISQTLLYDRLLPILNASAASGDPVDVLELNYAVAMDFINAYIFGIQNGSNLLQDIPFRKHFLHLYHCRKSYTFWPQEAPRIMRFLHQLGIRVVPKFVDTANQEIEAWCLSMCNAVESKRKPESSRTTAESPAIVYTQLAMSLTRPDPTPLPTSLTLASELLDHFAAGHETSGITLTYLMHELSLRPTLQTRLRHELLSLSPPLHTSHVSLPSPRALDALPLLDAILLETLRLHAPIPGPQPRITPPVPTTLAGHANIPPHTRVSALAYTLHRNAAVFPDPLRWTPERWLEAPPERREEMGRWWWAFGSGGRGCVGKGFAVQEMNLIVAAIYTNFMTEVVDDEGIEQADMYTAGPVGNRLVLRFEKVAKE